MPYLGNEPGAITDAFTQTFTGNGSTTNFTLSQASTTDAVFVRISGVMQRNGTDFTVSGTTLAFTTAPPDLANNIVVQFFTLGSVQEIAADAVTVDKLNLISTASVPSLEAKGDGSSQDGYIQLNCSQNSHGIKLKAPPHSASQSYTLTYPSAIVDGGFMKTDSSGNLSFAAVSSDLVKIQSTTASGASSVDFTSSHFDNSTYSSYIFKFLNVSPGTDGQHFIARTSTDGGSTYDSSGYDRVTEERNSTGTENQNGGDAQSEVRMTSTSNWGSASNESLSGTFFLYNPGASEYTQMNFTTAYMDDQAGTYWNSLHGSGQRTSAADVDGIQFLASSGTISGIITMYGMK